MTDNSSMLFSEGGPPDPIEYLRRVSGDEASDDDHRRSDSGDDTSTAEKDDGGRLHYRHRVQEDPPARERPAEGEAWPYRARLSFSRSLIFYGAGSITHEHKRACIAIQECRKLRQK